MTPIVATVTAPDKVTPGEQTVYTVEIKGTSLLSYSTLQAMVNGAASVDMITPERLGFGRNFTVEVYVTPEGDATIMLLIYTRMAPQYLIGFDFANFSIPMYHANAVLVVPITVSTTQ